MKKTLQLFLKLGLSVGIFMMFGLTAFAAAPAAGATLTGTAQTLSTSATAAAINAITVTDANAQEITAANDIRIRIPSTVNARWNTSDVTATIAGTESATVSTTVSYTGSNILILNVTGGFASANRTVIVSDLGLLGDAASAAAALEWSIDGGTAYGTGNANTNITINATNAAGDLTMSNATAGSNGTATLTLTVSVDMAVNDTVTFTAPAELDVSNLSTTAITGSLDGTTGVMTCTAAAQVVTCTLTTVGDHAKGPNLTIIFPASAVRGAYVAAIGNIADLAINDVSATPAGADINSDTTVATPAITVGDLTATNVAPESLSLSTISPTTFTFTTTAAIPTGARIEVVYPAGWNLAGAAGQVASSLSGLTGTWTATVSGQTLILTKTGGSSDVAGAKSLILNGIMTPPNEGSGGAYGIATTTSTPVDIEANAAVTADTIIGKVASSIVVGTPTGVTVTDNAGGGVLITWVDPSGSTDATKDIRIMKGTAPMPVNGAQYALVLKGVQKYIDTNVNVGDVVTYQLRASNGAGDTGATTAAVTFTVGSTLTPEEAIEPVTVDLTAVGQSGQSGQSGTATLTEANGQTTVVVTLTGATGTQQSHIHSGTCAETGDVAHALTSLVGGTSTTVLEMTLAELEAEGPNYINVHDATDATVSTACGALYGATTPTPEEVATPEETVEGVTPDETGTVLEETTVQGTGENAYATVSAGTALTTAEGTPYTGTFTPPTVKEGEVTPPEGAAVASDIYSIGSGDEGVTITASQPVTVYLPVKAGFVADMLKVYKIFKVGSDTPSATCTVVTSGESILFRCELTSFSDYVILEFEAPVEEEEEVVVEEEEEEEVAEAPFTDTKTHWSKDYVADLYAKGIVSGKTATKYAPDDAVTRAEFTKIIVGAFSIDLVSTTGSFTDISGHWGSKYIEAAKAAGVISGYADKTFKPDAQINRAEALKILLEAAEVSLTAAAADFSDVKASDWFAKYVNYAAANEIVKGYADGTFGPNKSITRGEVAKIVSLMIAE